jgi:multiple sugar transport system substrate-binding protein
MKQRTLATLTLLWASIGCKPPAAPELTSPFQGVTVRVAGADRPELAAWINSQRGEWTAQSGAQVELVTDESTGSSTPAADADIIILPSTRIGAVVQTGRAVQVPKGFLNSPSYELRDLAPIVHEYLIAWDRQTIALPISAESMLVYYRTDLVADEQHRAEFEQQVGRPLSPPSTWADFDAIARFFTGRDLNGDGAADSGVAVTSAGAALVCRAAVLGKSPMNLSFYFDVNTMTPLVAGPAFREAAEQWVKVSDCLPNAEDDDVQLATFAAGRAALAIGPASLAGRLLAAESENLDARVLGHVACLPLPASSRVYLHDKQAWRDLPSDSPNRVAVVWGTVAGVLASGKRADAAFDFLGFLTDREHSLMSVAASSYGLTPYRLSHVIDAATWSAAGWSTTGVGSYLTAMRENLTQGNAVSLLRIAHADEYQSVLDDQARAMIRKVQTPEMSLEAIAKAWQSISDRHGLDTQRRHYRYSVGMPVVY